MNFKIKLAFLLLLSAQLVVTQAMAVTIKPVSATIELKLVDGVNDVRVGDMVVRIIKAYVSTLTASSFYTYTIFVLPKKNETQWLLVTAPLPNDVGYNLREYETGDSNIQSIYFYKDGDQLFAVQASKEGLSAPAINLKKTGVEIKIFKFNHNWDIPMFDPEGVMHTKSRYMNASDAVAHEFFLH